MRLLILLLVVLVGTTSAFEAFPWLTHPSLEPFTSYLLSESPSRVGTLHVRFAGTTTIQIDDGEEAILIDGFFSRPGLLQILSSSFAPGLSPMLPSNSRIVDALGKLQINLKNENLAAAPNGPLLKAVLVAHSHYDHAMDSAMVASLTEAELIGSFSTANLARSQNFPRERIHTPQCGDGRSFKKIQVKFLKSPHSPDFLFSGDIINSQSPPLMIDDYKDGGNYSFLINHESERILIHPSANFERGLYANTKADVVFLSIGQLGKQPKSFICDYWHEVVKATHAKLVIPIHWDDFTRSLEEPLLPMPYLTDRFNRGMELLLKIAEEDDVPVRFLPPFKAFDVIDIATSLDSLKHVLPAEERGAAKTTRICERRD